MADPQNNWSQIPIKAEKKRDKKTFKKNFKRNKWATKERTKRKERTKAQSKKKRENSSAYRNDQDNCWGFQKIWN